MMGRMGAANVEATYRREHQRLWRALVAFAGDPDVASDAESEAFTQLIARGDAVHDQRAWVWRSAFRIASGLLATRGATTTMGSADLDLIDTPPIVELLSMLDVLTDQQRACVTLRYVGRFTGPEIADLLGTTPGTVRVQLHHAHDRLRQTMESP